MGEIVDGLAAPERGRIARLRDRGAFFWLDASSAETSEADLADALGIPMEALDPLLDFRARTPLSRKFHADGERVVFAATCFLTSGGPEPGSAEGLHPIEVHVAISGGYMLTLHEERVSLPAALAPELPEGRSEQYLVYAVLDAIVATGFDALNQIESAIESLQSLSTDMRSSRVRMATVRAINSRLSGMRRRLGPQRGTFDRISEEIGRVEGLEQDSERYFERIHSQLNRLLDGIDAAEDAMARLIDLRLNETIYWLTVVATIFLPLTFVTGFFGMNFGWMVDHIDTPLAFVLLGVGTPLLGAALTFLLVRRWGTPVEPDGHSTEAP